MTAPVPTALIRGSHLIGGEWTPSADGRELETYDPATGELLGTVADGGAADVDAAVGAARRALESASWRDLSPAVRARLLWRIGDLIDAHANELAELETRDQGQPLSVSRPISIPGAAEHFRYYAGWVTKLGGDVLPNSFPGGRVFNYTQREPVGVCGLIMPWNFPFMIAAWKIAPALACGNTCVLKPAEQTPLSTLRLAELVEEAGVPAGVVNVVTGGPEAGRALAHHQGVDKISFTGSTEVGREIVGASAGNLKRVSLELGGQTPMIVLADADLATAVDGALKGALLNSGQVCAGYSRFYVDRARADEFAERCAKAVAGLTLGNGLDPGTELGPLVSPEHLEKVDGLVQEGRAAGVEILTGGERAGGDLERGNFYRPTVFAGVRQGMSIVHKEIFGPVLSVVPYDEPEEAAGFANDTEYGLAASIWTRDVTRAHTLAAAIRAGTVFVNMPNPIDSAAPWGGFKGSGWGREMGRDALDLYTEVKSVWVALE